MSQRLPAPPPGGLPPPPPARPEDDALPRPEESWHNLDDEEDEDEDEDAQLLDPDAWPDDLDEPTVPEGLLDAEGTLEELVDLEVTEDDEELQDDPLTDTDLPLEDDLTDLGAPDDDELPVLSLSLEIDVDGVPTPARVAPGAARTRWLSPGAQVSDVSVVLRISGITMLTSVQREDGPQPIVLLGRDVLAGRFLLRP